MTLLFCILCLVKALAQKSDFNNISFKKADSIAKLDHGVSLENMPLLVYRLTNNLNTEVEKFRAIYMWVCLNIESDHGLSELTLRKRRSIKVIVFHLQGGIRILKNEFLPSCLKTRKPFVRAMHIFLRS